MNEKNGGNDAPVLALEKITFAYPGRPPLFRGLDFVLREGDRVALSGANGSGKTTLLRVIMGLETPGEGRVLHRGTPVNDAETLRRMRCTIGFVMQNSDDQIFCATVLEDVAFGPLNLGLTRREARDRAMATLEEMKLAALAERQPHQLSAGEKKMVSIAGVLSMRPEALLLDEPTASLDDESRERVRDLLVRLPLTRILVSHDREFLAQTSDKFIRIAKDGTIAQKNRDQ